MKYRRARLIQQLIEDLNSPFSREYFQAAIVKDRSTDDGYSVHLYSLTDSSWRLCDLVAFASSMYKLTGELSISLDSYSKGTEDACVYQSVRLD